MLFGKATQRFPTVLGVPYLEVPPPRSRHQAPPAPTERDRMGPTRVCLDALDELPALAVPDLDVPVRAGGGEALAVQAERHARDLAGIFDHQRLDGAEPHEVVPFPGAQVLRALLEDAA